MRTMREIRDGDHIESTRDIHGDIVEIVMEMVVPIIYIGRAPQ
jgi:hypothetical protein